MRGVNDAQLPLFWGTGCELVTVYPNGWAGLDETNIAKSVAAAAAAWGSTVTCPATVSGSAGAPSFEIVVSLAPPDARGAAALDYENKIVFVQSDWMYAEDALALTRHSSDSAGRIVDTDIEVNATDIAWATLDPGAPSVSSNGRDVWDLQAVLTHEFGHFIGLAHTCAGGRTGSDSQSDMPADPVDDQGRPLPACDDDASAASNPAAYASVMWYTVPVGAAGKRVLTADDVRAVCNLYPPSAASACPLNEPNDGCGCHAAAGRSSAAESALLLGVSSALTRRRRRRDRACHGPRRGFRQGFDRRSRVVAGGGRAGGVEGQRGALLQEQV